MTDRSGDTQSYVITDDSKMILGLPETLEAVEMVDFDAAGVGNCYIYHITYNSGLAGLTMNANLDDLDGEFDLSNFVVVNRNVLKAGTLSGGPFMFSVDGTPDMISGITLDSTNAAGTNGTWVITDDQGTILGLPPTLEAVGGVDFDAAGTGVCFIWYMRYEEGLTGLEMGSDVEDLEGLYGLSNSIQVTRN